MQAPTKLFEPASGRPGAITRTNIDSQIVPEDLFDLDTNTKLMSLRDGWQLDANMNAGICAMCPVTADDISINYTTRVLTLTPSRGMFYFYVDGDGVTKKFKKVGPVIFPAFTNTTGIWHFHFDKDGNPVTTQTPWTEFDSICSVYRILWNATLIGAACSVVEALETHPNTISGVDHAWKHIFGTIWRSGGNCVHNALNTTPNADGRNTVVALTSVSCIDDNLEYTVSNNVTGEKFSQDLGQTIAASLTKANSGFFKVRFQTSATLVTTLAATRFPFAWDVTTNRPQYIPASGVRTLVGNGNFFVYFLYALQDPRAGDSIRLVSAPAQYSTINNAQAVTWETIQGSFASLNDSEIRPLHRLIFEYRQNWDVGCKYTLLREVEDIRRLQASRSGGTVASIDATNVAVVSSTLLPTTNVQTALEYLSGSRIEPNLTGYIGVYSADDLPALPDGINQIAFKETWKSIGNWGINMGTYTFELGVINLVATGTDLFIALSGITVVGLYSKMFQITFNGVQGSTSGRVYYSTSGHGYTEGFVKAFTIPLEGGIVTLDMSVLTVGGTDWLDSTITGIRIDLGDTAGQRFSLGTISINTGSYRGKVQDLSGNELVLINAGAVPVSTTSGKGFSLNGTHTYLRTDNIFVFPPIFTFCCRLRNSISSASPQMLFGQLNTIHIAAQRVANTANLNVLYWNGTALVSATFGSFFNSADIVLGIEIDTTLGTMLIYRDGQAVDSASGLTMVRNQTSLTYLYIGRRSDGLYMNGIMSDIRLAARKLTAQEHLDYYVNQAVTPHRPSSTAPLGNAIMQWHPLARGKFVPTILFDGLNVGMTYGMQVGHYQVVGDVCTFCLRVGLTAKGTSVGLLAISGLPFNAAQLGYNQQTVSLFTGALTYTGQLFGYVNDSAAQITLQYSSEAGVNNTVSNANVVNGTMIMVSGSYFIEKTF